MEKLTREQISDLRNSFEVWQQDYDPVHDKEQHDMFALGVAAMNEMLAAMNGESVVVTDRMALDFHNAITDGAVGNDDVEEIKTGLRAALANISVPVTDHERREWMARGVDVVTEATGKLKTDDEFMDKINSIIHQVCTKVSGKIRSGEVDL